MAGEEISRLFGRAVQAMIQNALPGKDIYYGKVTKADAELTYPYVVVWVTPTTRTRRNLSGTISAGDSRLQLTGVGRNEDEVSWVLDHAGAALQGKKPDIDGWRPGRLWQMPTELSISKNEDLFTPQGSPTYRGVTMFRLSSEPVPEVV